MMYLSPSRECSCMDPQALGRHCWPVLWLIIRTVLLFVSLALSWYRNLSGKVTVAKNVTVVEGGGEGTH